VGRIEKIILFLLAAGSKSDDSHKKIIDRVAHIRKIELEVSQLKSI